MSNSSKAKDIALHFFNSADIKITPSKMKKTISQAKSMLVDYNKKDIINTIDYILNVKKIELYSLGYISTAIDNIFHEVQSYQYSDLANQEKEKLNQQKYEGVSYNVNSSKRNINKSKQRKFGVQSRVREELINNLFTK